MSNSYRQFQVAHPKNIKAISSSRQKSTDKIVYPNNRIYLESPQHQSSVKQFNRDKVIEQNQKMKKQVLALNKKMQQIISSNRRKKKYGINLDEGMDAQMQKQKDEVQKLENRISEMKKEIFQVKKENQYTHDQPAVIQKQNAIRVLEIDIKKLENQKNGLVKVRKEQEKALNFLKNNDGYNQKIQKSRSQLLKLKQQCKILAIKTSQNQKLLLKAHQKIVGKNKKIKDVQDRIRQNKQKLKKGNQHVVTIDMISEIEEQILKLQTQYKELQKSWHQKISNVEIQFNNRRVEEQKKLIILKDKERQAKLNQIRLKEFRKLIIQGRTEVKEDNPKQFRNRRNIKYLQKSSN